jgi:uncharacterized protein
VRRFLCFSDLHRDSQAASRLAEKAHDVDFVIGAGDFANRHEGLSDTLDILAAIDKPAILVPGNGETFAALQAAASIWKSAHVLHGSGVAIEGISFWGVGGGIPVTPFGEWSYDFNEEQAADMLVDCPERGVLVVHSPPISTVDHDSSGRVRGSQAVHDCMLAKQPGLIVCGHIHSDWEKQMVVGRTRILNAGPRGVVLEMDL